MKVYPFKYQLPFIFLFQLSNWIILPFYVSGAWTALTEKVGLKGASEEAFLENGASLAKKSRLAPLFS